MKVIEKKDSVTIIQEETNPVIINSSSCKVQSIESNIQSGPPGIDAYQIALNQGFVGTREEWLRSLSAYGIALSNGFVGSEQEWLESLKGSSGLDIEQEDDGKILSNNGSSVYWVDLEQKLNEDGITWDLGDI